MTFIGVVMPVVMVMIVVGVPVMGVIVLHCHDGSVTHHARKFSPITTLLPDFHIGPVGSLPGARQTKFLASLMSPVPLYLASCG